MAMEFLAFNDQFVSCLAIDDQDDDLFAFDIVQCTQIARAQLEFRKRIGSQAFDRSRGRRGIVLEPRKNGRLENPLLSRRQRSELPIRVVRDVDFVTQEGTSQVQNPPAASAYRESPLQHLVLDLRCCVALKSR
jgi:hypothetical protein